MFCKNCGKEIEEGSKFCSNCGNTIEEKSNTASDYFNALNNATQSNVKKKQVKPASGCAVVFLLFFLLVLVFGVSINTTNNMNNAVKQQQQQMMEQYVTSYDEFVGIIKSCGFTGNYTLEMDEYYDGHEVENSQCFVLQQGTDLAAIYTKDGSVYSIKYQDEDYMYKEGQVLHTLSEYTQKPSTTSNPIEKFTLLSSTSSRDAIGTLYIEGEIKNNTNKNYSYVQVTFNLYDDSGAQVGTAMDNINNFEANGVWKYKAMGLSANGATKCKLVEITGW